MKSKKETARQRRHQRIRKKVHGTGKHPRLVVYRSNSNIYAQLVDDDTGKTIFGTSDLKMKKGKKLENAKKVGEALAKEASAKKITTCIFDRGGYKYHGRVKALAEGAREGGLKF